MNKYVYAEATEDYWPQIKTIEARSYNDAVERIITKYNTELDDDEMLKFDKWDEFCEYLNEHYTIALSDLEIYEEL